MGWIVSHGDPRLLGLWPGAADYGDELDPVLSVAQIQCAAFAPALAPDPVSGVTTIPDNYVAAQVLQARNLIRAGIAGDDGAQGGYSEGVTLPPLDWQVKALLRPRSGKPKVR